MRKLKLKKHLLKTVVLATICTGMTAVTEASYDGTIKLSGNVSGNTKNYNSTFYNNAFAGATLKGNVSYTVLNIMENIWNLVEDMLV